MYTLLLATLACSPNSADLPPVRIDNGDGTYSYASAVGARVPSTRTEGLFELELLGPARYAWSPGQGQSVGAEGEYQFDDGTADTIKDPVDALIGGRTVTADHLEWEIIAIDREGLAARVADYDTMAAAAGEESQADVSASWQPEDWWDFDAGLEEQPGWFEMEAYSNYNCSGIKKHVWDDGDENSIIAAEQTDNDSRPIVAVFTDLGRCSGVLFDADHVLTAGHCIYDHATDTYVSLSSIQVCQSYGYADEVCAQAEARSAYSEFETAEQMKFDWGVIRIDADLGIGKQMLLSSIGDTGIEGISEHLLGGLPAIRKGQELACDTSNNVTHLASGGVLQNVELRTIRVDVTHGHGYSGGPQYYDYGSPGGTHYVVAVLSGSYTDPDRSTKGPKVPYYRTAMLAMP